METAITDAFLASIETAISTCMNTVKEESRKFAAALSAVRHLPSAQPVPSTPVPSTPVPSTPTPVPDTTHLEHRLSALELAYQRQVQKTIAGLSEDIGDIDGRLARLEREQREEPPTPWSWPGPSRTNEVIVMDDKSTVLDFGLGDMLVNVHHVEDNDVDMLPSVPNPVPVEITSSPAKEEGAKEETPPAEEEEEEGIELEDFEYEDQTYYKDGDNNVYKANDAGEVDVETPIGRWLEKRKSIKFYD